MNLMMNNLKRKEKKIQVKETYMATDVTSKVKGVDPTAEMVHDVAILLRVDGSDGPDLAMTSIPVVGMGQVRWDGHLEGGISLSLGLWRQLNLKLASTASDADCRKATSKVDVGHSSDESTHHFIGIGLKPVIGGDAIIGHSSEVVGGDLADQDTGVTVPHQQLLVTFPGQQVAPQLTEGRVHEEGVVGRKAKGLLDVAHV